MPEYLAPAGEMTLLDIIVNAKLAKSKSDARRTISQKGVRIDSQVADDALTPIKITQAGIVLQYGKKTFVRVKAK